MMDRDDSMHTEPSSISLQMGEAIVVRLSQLERELKAARRTTALVSTGLVASTALAILALGASVLFRGKVEAIETRQLVLKDAAGIDRATLRVLDDGTASFIIHDRDGAGRLRFSVLDNGSPGVALSDGRGRPRAVLGFLPEQGSTLVFADENGTTRTVLGLTGGQGASLAFLDGFGVTRASFGLDEEGRPAWSLDEQAEPEPAVPDTTAAPVR